MAHVGRGDVAVQAVGVEVEGGVALGAHPADEGEGDAQLLVQEEGVLLDLGAGVRERHLDVARVDRGVADPAHVHDASVLLVVDHVADEAGVHRVALAQVVGLDHGGLVGRRLVREHAPAAEAVVEQGVIERRGDVLGGEEMEVVGLLVAVGEQGAVVGELGVGDLGVVVRQGPVRVAPGLHRVVKLHAFVAAAQEPVVVLYRRAGHAEPGGVDVAAPEGIVVEMVVVGGVRHAGGNLAEVRVACPRDHALEVERVGQGVGLQDARGGLRDGVADVLPLLADFRQRIHPCQLQLGFLLHVVGLALLPRQAGVPGFEGGLGPGGGVDDPQGVELAPERGVELRLEGVARAQVHHGVLGSGEGRGVLGLGGRGVAHGDLLQREGAAQLVAAARIDHRVRRGRAGFPGQAHRGAGQPGRLHGRTAVVQRPGGGDRHHRSREPYARE